MQAQVTVYKTNTGKVFPDGCERFIPCEGIGIGSEETISLIRQSSVPGCGYYDAGQVVPPNYPNSVVALKITVPNIGVLYVDVTDFNANFKTQCNVCCIEA